jgi:Cdc6-like AAA superfamily ATPase
MHDKRGSKMNLIERIDLALQHARASRGDLAKALDISTQAISNLRRRPGSTMRPEHVAEAARFMRCDLYWLCTGKGDYAPEPVTIESLSFHAREVALWLNALPEDEQEKAFARVYQACADIHAKLRMTNGSSEHRKSGRSSST